MLSWEVTIIFAEVSEVSVADTGLEPVTFRMWGQTVSIGASGERLGLVTNFIPTYTKSSIPYQDIRFLKVLHS